MGWGVGCVDCGQSKGLGQCGGRFVKASSCVIFG